MEYPTTGITERLEKQERPAERAITFSIHSRDHSIHIAYRATLPPCRMLRTALGFFLGVMLALAALGAATITPTMGFCVLLALIALGLLLARGGG